jgi:hypothetical protein
MSPAERKAVGYLVRQACDLYAATMGSKPIWENRGQMREAIGQRIEAEMPLFESPGYLAEVLVAANQRAEPRQ